MNKEDADRIGQIGYYNGHPYPVQFPTTHRQSTPILVESGDPVVNTHRKLVPWDRDLEEQVELGLLRRIVPGDVNYAKFKPFNARIVAQAANPPVSKDTLVPSPSTPTSLPDGAQWTESGDGVKMISYRGQFFASLAGLEAYMDQIGAS